MQESIAPLQALSSPKGNFLPLLDSPSRGKIPAEHFPQEVLSHAILPPSPRYPRGCGRLAGHLPPLCLCTAITFEYDVPTLPEFTRRVEATLRTHPYLVAEQAGELLGYAYAAPFHVRAAYQWAAESTIYLRQDQRGNGLGPQLYRALERVLAAQNVLNCNACIALPQTEDATLTQASVRFHQRMGYTLVGAVSSGGI